MSLFSLSRRAALVGGGFALAGCGAVSALNAAGSPLATYDLVPRSGALSGRQVRGNLAVALPDAPAALASDRIVIRPSPARITYLPGARYGDDLPRVVQNLLVRSISATGRAAFVGRAEGAPVPDTAVLTRIDGFDVLLAADGVPSARIDLVLSLVDDRDQRAIASARFAQTLVLADDAPATIIAGFQALLDVLLPAMADFVLAQA